MIKAALSCSIVLLMLSVSAPGVSAQSLPAGPANSAEKLAENVTEAEQFVRLAASTGAFEIRSSQLARDLAMSDEVKAFAERMIVDHQSSLDRLMEIAVAEDIEVIEGSEPSYTQMEQIERLRSSTADFDSSYLRLQIEAHDAAIALYAEYAERGDNAALREHARVTLPALREHRAMLPDESDVQPEGGD